MTNSKPKMYPSRLLVRFQSGGSDNRDSATQDRCESGSRRRLSFIHSIRRVLLLPIISLAGCTISYPIWLGDDRVTEMCEKSGIYTFSYNGVSRNFSVNLIPESSLHRVCGYGRTGNIAEACIFNSYQIYVTQGVDCARKMAHELNHGFELHFIDRPLIYVASTSL